MVCPKTLFGVSMKKLVLCICAVGLFAYLYLVQIVTIKIEVNLLKHKINGFEDLNLENTETGINIFPDKSYTVDMNEGNIQLHFLKDESDLATNINKDKLQTSTPQYESDKLNLLEHNNIPKNTPQGDASDRVNINTDNKQSNFARGEIARLKNINEDNIQTNTLQDESDEINKKDDTQLNLFEDGIDRYRNINKDNMKTIMIQDASDRVDMEEDTILNFLQEGIDRVRNINKDNTQTNILQDESYSVNLNKANIQLNLKDVKDRFRNNEDNIQTNIPEDESPIMSINDNNDKSGKVKNFHDDMKYILQWTPADKAPFYIMGAETFIFTRLRCKFKNCYVTDNRAFFDDVTYFDAIAFNGRDVTNMKPQEFPMRRSSKQKYIYGAMESAYLYPACEPMLDDYFNWTWTYKLDSDFRWGYFTIYDSKGFVVGPAIDMEWPAEMEPLGEKLREKLANKTKAVAWFVSNCRSKNDRQKFAEEIEMELKKYGWSVDIYGACGTYKCPKQTGECDKILQTDYYFYFSFENSFAEDYVTEKVVTALKNFAVPIVYGGANYARFLPPGSYLNGRELGAKRLADTMNEIMMNQTMYYDFHRWRNHFKYVNNNENNSFCKLCAALNNRTVMEEFTVKENFRDWWNGKLAKCEVS